ncbi:MAG: YceD family protein [Coriobacteriia bacterium]
MPEVAPRDLRIDVSDILDNLADTQDAGADVVLDPIVVGTETFVPVAPAHVEVTLTYAGTAIVAEGQVTVDLQAVCSRCLREFVMPARGTLEGFYVRPGTQDELPEEQEYEFIDDRSIDLLPAVRAALAIEVPFAPVHDPDCAGICPTCGKDLATGACACEPARPDSPFAGLKDLLDESSRDH